MRLEGVELTSLLWHLAIHGQNADIIHFLEDNHVELKDKSYINKSFTNQSNVTTTTLLITLKQLYAKWWRKFTGYNQPMSQIS